MPYCCATGCKHVSRRETCNFFRFPANTEKFQKWKLFCRQEREPTCEDRLCSCHFKDGNKDNLPTISLPVRNELPTQIDPVLRESPEAINIPLKISRKQISIGCSIPNCQNAKYNINPEIMYHLFPIGNDDVIQKWIEACSPLPKTFNLESARVCSIHFDKKSFINDNGLLQHRAYPTLHLPYLINGSHSVKENLCSESLDNVSYKEDTAIVDKNKKKVFVNKIEQKRGPNYYKTLIRKLEHKINSSTRELSSLENKINKLKYNLKRKNNVTVRGEQILKKVFSPNQIKVLNGKKKARWTDDEFIVGYTLLNLSNIQCYNYITQVLNIPLPGRSTVQTWLRQKSKPETVA